MLDSDIQAANSLQIDPELYLQLMNLFFKQADEQMIIISDAIEKKDVVSLKQRLHYLKGSSSGLMLKQIYDFVCEFEGSVAESENFALHSEMAKKLNTLVEAEKNKRGC